MCAVPIVRQTAGPAGGAERFVSRAQQMLTQQHALSVSLIAAIGKSWKALPNVGQPFLFG
jgi:hypothetical protein